jgi:signal recognition particle receptor subunit beta
VAHLNPDRTQVNARIVFWGIPGAGVTTNLRVIHDKLRADHRGELQSIPTRLDPTTSYELLPIELGQVNGLRTQLQVLAVPGGAEHAPTRKQLLDRIDGLVLVVDSRPEQAEANLASLAELRGALEAYGRSLDELPVVVQYNRRDESGPYAIEELHRKLAISGAAVFEAVASQGKGVLQTLTTISKRVIRVLRESQLEPQAPVTETTPEPAPVEVTPEPKPTPLPPADVDLMESAILAEGDEDAAIEEAALSAEKGRESAEKRRESARQTVEAAEQAFDRPWESMSEEIKSSKGARIGLDFEIVSVGEATVAARRCVQLPLVLGNPEGETITLRLTVALDPLLDNGEE